MTALLEVDHVGRKYPVRLPGGLFGRTGTLHAVDDVSFELQPGLTLGLVGESGCGKSTIARLALGLLEPSEGHVRFDGLDMEPRGTAAWRELRRSMQMVYQDPLSALDRRMSVIDQVAEPLAVFRIGEASQRRARAAERLVEVGLEDHLHGRYPHELSGGQRQRVVIARAIATEPAILVCDEPISALDVSIQAQVVNLLADLQARRGIAMLFISHDLRIVRQVAHEVAVMYLGRIVEQGTPDQLFLDAAHPYTQALVSAVPSPTRSGDDTRIRLEGDPPNPVDRPAGCAFHPRCPIAGAVCRAVAPSLEPYGEGRLVACHRPGTSLSAAAAGAR